MPTGEAWRRVSAHLPHDVRGPADRIAAITAMAMVASYAITHYYEREHAWSTVLLLAAVAALGALLAGRAAGRWALAVAVAAGLAERLWRTPFRESDVLPYVREAVLVLLRGENPYTHLNLSTQPVAFYGFAYPPGPLLIYAPFAQLTSDLRIVERVGSYLVVLLLAALAWRAGSARASLAVALFGVFELAAYRTLDGSNDTTLTLLVLSAFVLLLYSSRRTAIGRVAFWASLVPFTLAVLFKQLVWPLAFFFLFYLWREHQSGKRYAILTVAFATAVTLPFFLWSPAAFVRGTLFEPFNHDAIWGANAWTLVEQLRPGLVRALGPIATVVSLLGMAAVAAYFVVRRPPRDLLSALGAGLVTFFAALILARWSTSVYYIFAFALVCALVALVPLRESRAA